MRNLLDNARRHAAAAVTVELAEVDGRATLSVADDGPGIPADRRAEVFERFTRLDEARAAAPAAPGSAWRSSTTSSPAMADGW